MTAEGERVDLGAFTGDAVYDEPAVDDFRLESPDGDGPSAASSRSVGRLTFKSLRAWRDEYAPPRWLIRGFLIDKAFDVFGGAEKSLKSWLMHHVAIALAARVPLFGADEFLVPERATVLLLTGEGGVDLVQDRIEHSATACTRRRSTRSSTGSSSATTSLR